jgi:hypothetical protein
VLSLFHRLYRRLRRPRKPRTNDKNVSLRLNINAQLESTHNRTKISAKETEKSSAASLYSQSSQALQINSEVDVCQNFTIGDRNKGEFYSPRFPNEYPNNTECIAVITGMFIESAPLHSLTTHSCDTHSIHFQVEENGIQELLPL